MGKQKGLKRIKMTIKRKLLLTFLLLVIIPAITIGAVSYLSANKAISSQITYAAEASVDLLNEYIDSTVEPKVKDAEFFAENMSIDENSVKKNSDLRKRLDEYASLHPEAASIYVGTPNGDMIQYPVKKLPDGYDPRERDWYKNAEATTDTFISDAYLSASGEMVVTISKKLTDGTGIIGINLKVDSIKDVAKKVTIGQEGYSFILGREKQYVYHPTKESGSEATDSFMADLYESNQGHLNYELDGELKSMTFTTNKLTGWKIAGTMYKSEVDAASAPIVKSALFIEILAILIGIIVAVLVTRSIIRPIQKLKDSAIIISKGNLSEPIEVTSKDEVGELGNAFTEMKESLRDLISQVDTNTEQVAAAAEELSAAAEETKTATIHVASSTQQIASGAEVQTVGIEKTAKAIEKVGQGINTIHENVEIVNEEARLTATHAIEGGESVKKTVDQMNTIFEHVSESDKMIKSLNDRSKEINEISNVISGIAEQTNLLALNAAIEAARAGEQGKGFAVVAEEVRKLAEQSQTSAKQITGLIKDIQTSTEQTVDKMKQAADSVQTGIDVSQEAIVKFQAIIEGIKTMGPKMEEVSQIVKGVTGEMQSVTSTSFDLANIAKENTAASESVAASTEEQIAVLEEVTASAKSLSSMSEELQELIRKFTI
ncbi:HAMP domain-containing protein [Niallia circulans]|uniref:HAMP domain-containing protein n=1 Tax=Niallia circulans TaxID=1397 RepID=A0A553SF25_NIACI|nr:methyl-accepting chemotaxis protein [Niallia circulans]TRZ35590.1 HAMP domain-containing protein [Niallia circulans]